MSLRNAMRQSRLLTFAVIAFMAWLVVTLVRVWSDMGARWETGAAGGYIGSNPIGGAMGVLVMLGLLALLLVFYSEVGHSDPGPSTWPPEE